MIFSQITLVSFTRSFRVTHIKTRIIKALHTKNEQRIQNEMKYIKAKLLPQVSPGFVFSARGLHLTLSLCRHANIISCHASPVADLEVEQKNIRLIYISYLQLITVILFSVIQRFLVIHDVIKNPEFLSLILNQYPKYMQDAERRMIYYLQQKYANKFDYNGREKHHKAKRKYFFP